MKCYSRLNAIPTGHSDPRLVYKGCLVLEGGAFRGLYTQGALDALMQHNLTLQTTIGVSAGALSGTTYVSGQIGRSARLNLQHRHNSNYIGLKALKHDRGITGFTFVFKDFDKEEPFDETTFCQPDRRFIAVATSLETGKAAYFEKGVCADIFKAVQASATVPHVSQPVQLEDGPYLDGGCADAIPLGWAIEQGFEKILVIRTRNRDYRKPAKSPHALIDLQYGKYPAFAHTLKQRNNAYNQQVEHINELEQQKRILVLAPKEPVNIARFEGNMEKLGALYWQGYHDANERIGEIKDYFGI